MAHSNSKLVVNDKGASTPHESKNNEQNLNLSAEDDFIVTFDIDDPMDPKNKSQLRKWLVVITVTSVSFCVTNTSSLYTATYDGMEDDFGTSRILSILGLTTYVFGLGLGPMLIAPLSEFYGRRQIYLVSLILFVIWKIPCAVASNIQTMLIARFWDGFAGSAFLSVAGGTIGDMFTIETLQEPMLLYSAGPLLGPSSGVLMGGFINYYLDWRRSFYRLLIWSGIMLVTVAIFVPETYAPVLLRQKAQRKRNETGDERWTASIEIVERSIFWTVVRSLYRPFLMLVLDPMCLNLCLYSAILLGILYLFFGAFNIVFQQVYSFNLWQAGCTFLGILAGQLIAVASSPIWHRIYLRLLNDEERKAGHRNSEPEFRLPGAIVGAWFCVVGLLWFAWTILPSVHWMIPITGTAFFGCGIVLVFTSIFTFLVEAYPLYAASALAANAFARSTFAAALYVRTAFDDLYADCS